MQILNDKHTHNFSKTKIYLQNSVTHREPSRDILINIVSQLIIRVMLL